MKRIVIGSDKTGYPLKETVREHLERRGFAVEDVGNTSPEANLLYYEVAARLAAKVQSHEYEQGILFCGTGMGMNIAANKFKGIYAGVVESGYCARMAAAINKVNVLTMGAFVMGSRAAIDAVDSWLDAGFLEGVMEERKPFISQAYDKLLELENGNMK